MRAKPAFPILRRRHYLGRHLRHGWTLHEGSGSPSDVADPLAPGTLTGAGVTWKEGRQGWAINQTATAAHYIAMPSLPVSRIIPAQFTVVFAYNPGASGDRPTFGFLGSGGTNAALPLGSYDSVFNIGNGSSAQFLTALPVATANTVNIYAITDDGTNYTVYWNGKQQTQNAITINPASGSNRQFCIGGSGLDGGFEDNHAGSILWFYILDRALSHAEVSSLGGAPYEMFAERLTERVLIQSVATTPSAPTAPSSLTATAIGASKIDLAWTDNSADEERFYIERSTDGVNFSEIAHVAANTTSYSDTGLDYGTTYSYRVRAYKAGVFSTYSNTDSAATDSIAAYADDIAAEVEGLYGVRKLLSAYAGNCVRLRRDSDNAEQDIGFDVNGDLDTGAITTFLGAANGFLVTWYDQSGNGYDMTQATAANQPAYVASGINSLPTFQWDGTNDYLQNTGGLATPFSGTGGAALFASLVARFQTTGAIQSAFTLSSSSSAIPYHLIGATAGGAVRLVRQTDAGAALAQNGLGAMTAGNDYVWTAPYRPGSDGRGMMLVDGTAQTVAFDMGSPSSTVNRASIGVLHNDTTLQAYFKGYLSEVLIYSADGTVARTRNVVRYQNDYFGVFTFDLPLTAENAADHLDIPVHSGADFQAIHPDVYDSGEGLTTDGHRFWMVHTPYPGGGAAAEKPNIVVSDAAPGVSQVWSVPSGLTNPIANNGVTEGDTDLLLAQDGNWYVYWFKTGSPGDIRVISSSDGVTWGSETQLFTVTGEGSPMVVWDGTQYVMYTVDNSASPNGLKRRTSASPASGWSAATTIAFSAILGRELWDSNITYDPDTGTFHGFFGYANPADGTRTVMYYGTSSNGTTWTLHRPALLNPQVALAWDNGLIYRGSAIKRATGFDLWYSAFSSDWHTGYTEVLAAVAAPSALSATATGDTTIDLAWTDNSGDETGFSIERGTDGVNFSEIDTAAANATSYNDTGLTAGTLYYYRVRAFNNQGYSGYSNIDSATTTGGGPGPGSTVPRSGVAIMNGVTMV